MFFLSIEMKKICLKIPKKIIFGNMHKMHLHYILDFCYMQFSKKWNILHQKLKKYEMNGENMQKIIISISWQ